MTSGDVLSAERGSLAERLERAELVAFPVCPFPLPDEADLEFLRTRQPRHISHESIEFDFKSGKVNGHRLTGGKDVERLARLMRFFSNAATEWLASELPLYSGNWTRKRIALRNEEEATRLPHHRARNDLLHIDNDSDHTTAGQRILRLFVNINPIEDRVWITSEIFETLLARYQRHHRIPARSPREWCEPLTGLQRLLNGDLSGRPAYDSLMLDLQQFLRSDEAFQENAAKHLYRFPPRSAWLVFADGLCHAELRGQHALVQSYFVPVAALARPELSPLMQIVDAGNSGRVRRAG